VPIYLMPQQWVGYFSPWQILRDCLRTNMRLVSISVFAGENLNLLENWMGIKGDLIKDG